MAKKTFTVKSKGAVKSTTVDKHEPKVTKTKSKSMFKTRSIFDPTGVKLWRKQSTQY